MKAHEVLQPIQPDESIVKKTYVSPCLREYGAIHLATQATGTTNGDGGPTMMV